jgi:TonB family protein
MQCSNCGHDVQPGTRFCTKCGALVAAQPQPQPSGPPPPVGNYGAAARPPLRGSQMAQPPRKSSGCGKVLLILGVLGLVVLVGVGIAGYYGYRFAEGKLKSSEAYTVAINALKENPEVARKLGDVKETGFPLGNFQENADGTGMAAYKVSVTGTKTNGDYVVVMRRQASKWSLLSGKLTLANGDVINVKAATPSGNDWGSNSNVIPPPPPMPSVPAAGKVVSGGVLDSQAIDKPEPDYPAVAKAARASGTVTVAVTVDESGEVISAQAVSGHPLLQQAAVAAAKKAIFKPTLLSGRPVKMSGILTYHFTAP